MLESRSALDRTVHTRGAQLLEQAAWHPVGRPTYPGLAQFKEWRDKEGEDLRKATINLARDALDYKRLRGEQEMEQLTNRFARMSLAEAKPEKRAAPKRQEKKK